MIFRERNREFPARRLLLLAALLAPFVLSNCATATIEDAVPQSANPSAAETAVAEAAAVDTGEFPNLNIPRRGETAQLTAAERAAKAAELAAARRQTQQGQPIRTDIAQLRKLGSTHTEEALDEIESE